MDFTAIQSLGIYTKNMEMQLKWQKKKADNDFTADGSTKLTDPTARQAEEIRKAQADGTAKLSSQIRTKLATGKKLTQEEMTYLEKHDPQMYQKVKAIEAEQKSYEKKLKSCKTKEEVQQVRTERVAASLSVVNNVKNNPAIPEGAKLGLMWQELQKNMAVEETVRKFVESGQYAQLPTEAEKQEVEKELKELKEAELGIKDTQESSKEKEPAEHTEEPEGKAQEPGTGSVKEDIPAEHTEKTESHESAKKEPILLQERRFTRAQLEAAPETLKVKRAKARAAYKGSSVEIPEQIVDVKVK